MYAYIYIYIHIHTYIYIYIYIYASACPAQAVKRGDVGSAEQWLEQALSGGMEPYTYYLLPITFYLLPITYYLYRDR